jgi:hypothetical protein
MIKMRDIRNTINDSELLKYTFRESILKSRLPISQHGANNIILNPAIAMQIRIETYLAEPLINNMDAIIR